MSRRAKGDVRARAQGVGARTGARRGRQAGGRRRKLDLDRFHAANHGGGGERRELDDAVGSVDGASYAGASSTQAMGMNAEPLGRWMILAPTEARETT